MIATVLRLTRARPGRLGAALAAGVLASELGAVLMAMVTCTASVLGYRAHLLQPFAILAANRFGLRALYAPTVVEYLWAAVAHLALAAAWGLAYGLCAALVRADKARWAALALGLLAAAAAQAVGHDLASALAAAHGESRALSLAGHLAWALGFAAYPSLFWRMVL